jgi:hypothetical protein
MDRMKQVEQRRTQIVEQAMKIRSMELGALSEQMLPVKHKDETQPVLKGPYYVLSRRENGKTRSRRVGKDELEQIQRDVDNRRRFESLCAEFKELTQELGALDRQQDSADEALKKGLKSRSKRVSKSSE